MPRPHEEGSEIIGGEESRAHSHSQTSLVFVFTRPNILLSQSLLNPPSLSATRHTTRYDAFVPFLVTLSTSLALSRIPGSAYQDIHSQLTSPTVARALHVLPDRLSLISAVSRGIPILPHRRLKRRHSLRLNSFRRPRGTLPVFKRSCIRSDIPLSFPYCVLRTVQLLAVPTQPRCRPSQYYPQHVPFASASPSYILHLRSVRTLFQPCDHPTHVIPPVYIHQGEQA